jgi:hypothetical protein
MATGAGVITGKFAEVAREAQRRLDAGEDPQSILADVSAAVLANPTLQRQFEIQRIAAEQSIAPSVSYGGGSRGGTSSSQSSDIGKQIKEEFGLTENEYKNILNISSFSGKLLSKFASILFLENLLSTLIRNETKIKGSKTIIAKIVINNLFIMFFIFLIDFKI